MSVAIARFLYGPLAQPIELPAWLSGASTWASDVSHLPVVSDRHRRVVAVGIWLGIERSRFGASVAPP
jgi:hypothetical protein